LRRGGLLRFVAKLLTSNFVGGSWAHAG